MSETSNDIAQPGLRAETLAADDTRMAAPSGTDIERGAAPAQWAPSELHNADKQAQPEAAADFGIERAAQALGLPQQTIDSTKRWLSGAVTFTDAQLDAFDAEHQGAAKTELRALWGDKYDGNVATIVRYLGSLPANAGAAFLQARDDAGRALANDPAQLQRVLGLAQRRGSFTLPPAVRDPSDLNAQIAAIERTMRTDRAAYNSDELLQARFRELLAMRERAR